MNAEAVKMLDELDVKMGGDGGMLALNLVLAFVMFGVALGIKPKNFLDILKNPKSIILGILCQILLLPALTFLLTITFKDWLPPMISLGMILVASCPGGNISNFITQLSRGNTELSVGLTAFNTAACIITTPLNFSIWGNMYLRFAAKRDLVLPNLEIPFADVFVTIVLILGIPLVLGILCAQYLPALTEKLKKPMKSLSVFAFIAMVFIAFGGNFDVFIKDLKIIELKN